MTQRILKSDISSHPPTPPPTKGLTQLDRERAESMADEGGAAAAVVEGPEPTSSGVDSTRAGRSSASKRKQPRGRKDGPR